MRIKKPKYGIIIVGLMAGIFSGCSFGTPKITEDPMAIYTLAAGTVAAQLTGTAAMLPTMTETSLPTQTPEPSPTPKRERHTETLPALTESVETLVATSTQVLGFPTNTPVSQVSGDSAAFGSQSPADNTVFETDKEFTLMISMINNGSTTWNTEYKMVFQSGAPLSSVKEVSCSRESTKPMQTCDFYIAAKTPINPGKYISRYWLVNAQGAKMPGGEVYFSFEVK